MASHVSLLSGENILERMNLRRQAKYASRKALLLLPRPAQELHLAAIEKLERDLSRNEKNASRALKERLQEARAAREAA